jgi:hypothetical protein
MENGSSEKPHPQPLSSTERGGEGKGREGREGRGGGGRKVRYSNGLQALLLPLSVQERGLGG